ncbi:MAG: SRPBCC domain-containing protein [Planctomycetales bacterium]|nr:SRPBCC domain-containing protein [Planctomycetales bacterium]
MTATSKNQPQYFRVVIEAPIERVWEALTQRDQVLPFFFNSVLHTTSLAPGAPVRMRSPNGKFTGVVGEVLELEPPFKYSHTFKFTNLDDPICVVEYELKSIEGGTEFTLVVRDAPAGTKTEKYMLSGGKMIVAALKHWVEKGRPSFTSRLIGFVNALSSPFTPRKCRSENWPLDKKIK